MNASKGFSFIISEHYQKFSAIFLILLEDKGHHRALVVKLCILVVKTTKTGDLSDAFFFIETDSRLRDLLQSIYFFVPVRRRGMPCFCTIPKRCGLGGLRFNFITVPWLY